MLNSEFLLFFSIEVKIFHLIITMNIEIFFYIND